MIAFPYSLPTVPPNVNIFHSFIIFIITKQLTLGTILFIELQILIDFTSFSTNVSVAGPHTGHHTAFSHHVSLVSSGL